MEASNPVRVPRTKKSKDAFELYQTFGNGNLKMVQVSDPLHMQILSFLQEGPMSTTEISEATSKSQSTLSVHLDEMVEQGLIVSEYDKNDSRRKIYTLSASKVAASTEPIGDGFEEMRKYIMKCKDSTADLYKSMVMAILIGNETCGMDVSYGMEKVGSFFAETISADTKNTKVEEVIEELQEYYERNGLGEVCVYTFLPLTIIIRNPDECPFKLKSMAAFSHGVFVTALNKTVNGHYEVTKSEIFGTGNNYYKFVIELSKKDHP